MNLFGLLMNLPEIILSYLIGSLVLPADRMRAIHDGFHECIIHGP